MRQPIRTISGIILLALAVSIVLTCVGQYITAVITRQELDRQFDTVALATDADSKLRWPASGEYYAFEQNLIENYVVGEQNDIIKTISETGLLSAYIPELTPDNFTNHYTVSGNYAASERGVPYNCAMLVITLDNIGTEIEEVKKSVSDSVGTSFEIVTYATMTCEGTVEQVISLQEGYNDPVGWKIHLTIKAKDRVALEDMDLRTGQRYLVYGMEYYDNDWLFRKSIAVDKINFAKPFDMDKVHTAHPLGPEYEQPKYDWVWNYYENTVKGKPEYQGFDAADLENGLKCCSLTVCNYAALDHVVSKRDENGNLTGIEALTDQKVLLEDEYSDMWMQWGTSLISRDEYMQMYAIPTLTELNSDPEAFLASDEGASWRNALDSMEINNHAFPVLAVEKLGYQAEFARENARIVQGRDFTEAELNNGEKVCIISETLAAVHGLEVGDTITMQTYFHDPNITNSVIGWGYPSPGNAYPQASYFSNARGFSSQPESYTIVGHYRQPDHESGTLNSYGFLSDTIFIPKASATGKMVTWDEGLYRSIIIQNGKLNDFYAELEAAGYEDMFVVYDRGYNEICSGLNAYEDAAQKAIYVGCCAYAIILLLFLLLFPGREKQTLATMESLGASRKLRMVHILSVGFGIILPGTILGCIISLLIQKRVTEELIKAIGVQIPIILSGNRPMLIGGIALFGICMAATALYGIHLARDRGIARKGV